ncbi:MAG: triose-phosphate isomerase [Candidatus Thermoplasmatota archaeon]|nr:triose-phosphate isomerase [Candidatus Thermoplasmatota archaeon]
MRTPAIILNMKTYRQVDGKGSMDLAVICEEVAKETGVSIIVCPPTTELSKIASEVSIPVFAQNADIWDPTVRTGATTLTEIKEAGAKGLLVNHSECRRTLADIQALVEKARELDLVTIVCSNNVQTSKAVTSMGPDFVAMEPPELIGGDISVTSSDPDIVKDTVRVVASIDPEVKVLTGAGVKTRKDVEMALELGTYGVLLASGVVKAESPKEVLISLASGTQGTITSI